MNSRARLMLSVIVVASVALGVTACKHETLDSGTQGLGIMFTPNPGGSGRFEDASIRISKIQFLPTDPETGAIFGDQELQLVFGASSFDLSNPNSVGFEQKPDGTYRIPYIALSQGTYRVTNLVVNHASLVDTNLAAPPFATCMDGVAVVDASTVGAPEQTTFVDPPNLAFTVRPGQTTLSVKLDVPAFLSAYQAAFTCQAGCGPGGANCVVAPFNETAYRDAVLANLSIE